MVKANREVPTPPSADPSTKDGRRAGDGGKKANRDRLPPPRKKSSPQLELDTDLSPVPPDLGFTVEIRADDSGGGDGGSRRTNMIRNILRMPGAYRIDRDSVRRLDGGDGDGQVGSSSSSSSPSSLEEELPTAPVDAGDGDAPALYEAELAPDEHFVSALGVLPLLQDDDNGMWGKFAPCGRIGLCIAVASAAAALGVSLGIILGPGGEVIRVQLDNASAAPCKYGAPWRHVGTPIVGGVGLGIHGRSGGPTTAELPPIEAAFGSDISLSASGDRIAVAGGRLGESFSVFEFNRTLQNWTRLGDSIIGGEDAPPTELRSIEEALEAVSAVALSGDGRRVAVGLPYRGDNDDAHSRKGGVEIYEYSEQKGGGSWTLVGRPILGPRPGAYFGDKDTVVLSDDGHFIAIGDYRFGGSTGRVQVYRLVSVSINGGSGEVWTRWGNDIVGDSPGDQFGSSVSLSGNGTVVAAGSMLHANATGSVRVFRFYSDSVGDNEEGHGGSGNWFQVGETLRAGPGRCLFGWPVSMSKDASRIAVSSTSFLGREVDCNDLNPDESTDVGEVRIFEYDAVRDSWVQMGPGFSGEDPSDGFGWAISLSGDGTTLAVGSPISDRNKVDSGYSRTYRYECGNWTMAGKDLNGTVLGDWTGFAVDMSYNGNRLAVGAPTDFNVPDLRSGMAMVYSHAFADSSV